MKWFEVWTLFSGGTGFLLSLLPTVNIEPRWLVLCLAMLGGLLFGFGVRMQRYGLRLLGMLIQLISLYVFVDTVWYPFSASILKNSYFLLCLCIALIAFFSAYILEKWLIGGMRKWDRMPFIALFLLGIAAWYVGGMREVYMHVAVFQRLSGIMLFVAATSILAGLLAENLQWKKLNILLLMQLPVMLVLLFFEYLNGLGNHSLLTGWGATVWPITFFIQYRALPILDNLNLRRISCTYHLISLWLLFFFCNRELGIGIAEMRQMNSLISHLLQPLFAFAAIVALVILQRFDVWPVRFSPAVYLWGGSTGIVLTFLLSYA